MKNMIAIYALLMVLSMIFVSCEHKELCYSHLQVGATPLERLIAMCIKQYYIYAQPAVKW